VALAFGSFAVASAIFLILELNQPFSGLFRVPSAPMKGPLPCWADQAEQRRYVSVRSGRFEPIETAGRMSEI
jgi:hypothetical protein